MAERRMISKLAEILIEISEHALVILLSVLIALTIYTILGDLWRSIHDLTSSNIEELIGEISMLLIYAEILRSVMISRSGIKDFLIRLSEIGFIVVVRELLIYAIVGESLDILLATLSLLVLSIAIYVLIVKISKV